MSRPKFWSRYEISTAARMWSELGSMRHKDKAVVIGEATGRKPGAVLHRYETCGDRFDGAPARHSVPHASHRPPDHVLAERDARLAADTRSPAAIMLGEPPPGRSALDRYTPPAPYRVRAWADAFGSQHSRLGGE